MNKIKIFSNLFEGSISDRKYDVKIKKYKSLSESHTTDGSKRLEREAIFKEIIEKL